MATFEHSAGSTLVSGKYRLLRPLAEGGMGEVWECRHEVTGRNLAIKFLLRTLVRNPEALDRFVREARATAKLKHPSIVDVFDAGRSDDGRPYLVMELLEGESLEERMLRDGRLPVLPTLIWLSQVAWALDAAHAAGIVHRDLSSANVFLTRGAREGELLPKILDFGVSKFTTPELAGRVRTGDGAVLGSPSYMSPEQARGAETVDARSDVWSLGVLLYECLCGQAPFSARNYNALMLNIVSQRHAPLSRLLADVDVELESLVEGCLQKHRDDRITSAREVAIGLERIALRLSEERAPGALRRRATDRLSIAPGQRAPLQTMPEALPDAVPANLRPMGVRLARSALHGVGLVAVMCATLGVLLGVLIGHVASSRATQRRVIHVASQPVPTAERTAAAGPDVVPVVGALEPEPEPSSDLVRAAARGLGIEGEPAPPPTEVESVPPAAPVLALRPPRANPY